MILLVVSGVEAQSNDRLIKVSNVEFTMKKVEGGSFTMGCDPRWSDECLEWEKPAHHVTVGSFYIGETEVTQELWEAVMGNNPSEFKGDDRPVETISHEEAESFIDRLNELTGEHFRFPTEAEWEFAAQGGTKSGGYKYSGSNNIDEVGWHEGNSDSKTHPIKMKKANELGLYDMSGNVLEWCSDWWETYTDKEAIDPQGPSSGYYVSYRGGCWGGDARYCRNSYRNSDPSYISSHFIGLRLAMSDNQDTSQENHEKTRRPTLTDEETRAMVAFSCALVAEKLSDQNVAIGLYSAISRELDTDEFEDVLNNINDEITQGIETLNKMFDPIKKSYIASFWATVVKACDVDKDPAILENYWKYVQHVLNMKVDGDFENMLNWYNRFEHPVK